MFKAGYETLGIAITNIVTVQGSEYVSLLHNS